MSHVKFGTLMVHKHVLTGIWILLRTQVKYFCSTVVLYGYWKPVQMIWGENINITCNAFWGMHAFFNYKRNYRITQHTGRMRLARIYTHIQINKFKAFTKLWECSCNDNTDNSTTFSATWWYSILFQVIFLAYNILHCFSNVCKAI
jgi:hypothetical protein